MSSYVRPPVAAQTYRDADGAVIEYGNRWGGQAPPEQSYSVDSHPERFAPLHQIAEALADHLQHTYDVEVTDDPSCAQDLRRSIRAVRAIRLTPAAEDAAPLTFVFTDYPGLVVHAGLLHDFPYPSCGCDACDESLGSVADQLEWTVLAVTSGGYREEVRGSALGSWISYQLTAEGSSRGGSSRGDATAGARARRRAAASRLDAMAAGWAAWPARPSAAGLSPGAPG